MAVTPAVFSKQVRGFIDDLAAVERDAVDAAALVVKESVAREIRQVAPRGTVNVGKAKRKVGVRYDYNASQGTALVRATGPLHLIESDTRRHREPRQTLVGQGPLFPGQRRAKRASTAKRRVVVIPGVGVRAWADHPGTRGRHPWRKGVAAATPRVPKVLSSQVDLALRKHFRG